jgi:hypothetical protein
MNNDLVILKKNMQWHGPDAAWRQRLQVWKAFGIWTCSRCRQAALGFHTHALHKLITKNYLLTDF